MLHPFSDVNPFLRDPLTLFKQRSEQSVDGLAKLRLGLQPVYLVTDPALAKNILRSEEAIIDKGRLVQKLKTVIGESSITLSGESHQQRRAVIHQHLARGIMKDFVPEITSLIRGHILKLLKEESFDAHEVTAPLALRVIVSLLFGKDAITPQDESALMQAVYVAEAEMTETMFRIFPRSPWRSFARRREVKRSREMMGLVVERVQGRAATNSIVKELEKLGLSSEEIRDEVLLLLLAGHHTTGNAAAWVLYFLATESGLRELLALEGEMIVNESGDIDPLKMPKAHTSLRVAREVLRLFPPFYWLSREVKAPMILQGRKLKRGTSLIISPWLLQHDPAHWVKPEEFRLDRLYNTPAFMPFGLGPRACIGIGLGLLELQLLALEVAGACSIEVLSDVPAGPATPLVTLLPPPIRLKMKPLDTVTQVSDKRSSAFG